MNKGDRERDSEEREREGWMEMVRGDRGREGWRW